MKIDQVELIEVKLIFMLLAYGRGQSLGVLFWVHSLSFISIRIPIGNDF